MPEITPNREVITTHHFDIDVTPAQIVWSKRDLEVDERKAALQSKAKQIFKFAVDAEVAKETDEYPTTQYNPAIVDVARIAFETRMSAINSAVTHEDVDALMET
jgi:hypothetical protein